MAEPTLYLFDGFNLLYAGDFGSPDALRDLLASWVAAKGARGVLVFDGQGESERHGSLEVRWAPDADTLIERLAVEHRSAEQVAVVSSDAAVRGTAGAQVRKLSSQTFLEELARPAHVDEGRGDLRDRLDPETLNELERLRRGQAGVASVLTRISEHVYWMPPGPPDRPSLCGVVGARRAVMLDAGSSKAHTRAFLDALRAESGARPGAVLYTHSHWDHVLGGAEVGGLVIAHTLTAEQLLELAARDWSDEGLDRRVAAGLSSPQYAAHVKEEMPAPREVEVAPADIVFRTGLDLELGGVTVRVRHVGGGHSADSSVMCVDPDGVLFLGDCLCDSPTGALTAELVFPLVDAVLAFGAELYVEGHHSSVYSRRDFEELIEKLRVAERAVREGETIPAPDEDTASFLQAFAAGRAHRQL